MGYLISNIFDCSLSYSVVKVEQEKLRQLKLRCNIWLL
jgi:hypothetical protein